MAKRETDPACPSGLLAGSHAGLIVDQDTDVLARQSSRLAYAAAEIVCRYDSNSFRDCDLWWIMSRNWVRACVDGKASHLIDGRQLQYISQGVVFIRHFGFPPAQHRTILHKSIHMLPIYWLMYCHM